MTTSDPHNARSIDSALSDIAARVLSDARVLLVDDNILCCKIGYRLLSGLGACVECATTGDEALEKAAQREFDFIVIDASLGQHSGIDLAEKLIGLGTQPETTAIFAVTPLSDVDLAADAERLGVHAVLEKPLSRHGVVRAIEDFASL